MGIQIQPKLMGYKIDGHKLRHGRYFQILIDNIHKWQVKSGKQRAPGQRLIAFVGRVHGLLHGRICHGQRRHSARQSPQPVIILTVVQDHSSCVGLRSPSDHIMKWMFLL